MSISCVQHTANIFLNDYEKRFIDKMITTNKGKEAEGYFDHVFKEIYPSKFILKNTNISTSKSNYFDLTISIVNGKLQTPVIQFPLTVINYPW